MSKSTISTFQFLERFPDAKSAQVYMEAKRWGGTPDSCLACGVVGRVSVRKKVGYFRCLECKKDFTVRTGTIFERSHVPLHKWLFAIYLLVTSRKGISSMQLAKEIGVTQKTAWFMLQRLREACGNNDTVGLLNGLVEADEAYFGGKEANKHEAKKTKAGRGAVSKTGVLGMRERDGHTQAVVLSGTSKQVIHEHITQMIEPTATLITDEHRAYMGVPVMEHLTVNHYAKQYVDGMAHTNGIESVWAVLKRGYYGVYHQFSVKHLQRYVDEFTYRLNEGNVKAHTMERLDALLTKSVGCHVTYKTLTVSL